jgi:hypothetical protein
MLKSGKFDFLIISSSNKWKKAFDFFIVILALYSTYSCTYFAAFGLDSNAVSYLSIAVEVIFAIEMILNFLTEFWGDDFFYPVRDFKKIAIRYLKNAFVFDLLSVVPFRYFFWQQLKVK